MWGHLGCDPVIFLAQRSPKQPRRGLWRNLHRPSHGLGSRIRARLYIYVLFPPSTVLPIRHSNHEPLPSHRGGLGAENTRQRRPRSQLVFRGPLWVWGILCIAWKVLMARGGRIGHYSGRNSSPNTDLRNAQRAEGNIVLIKVRMPLRVHVIPLCVLP